MNDDITKLREVPRPEDDEDTAKKHEAIAILEKTRHTAILQLAEELGYDPNQPSTSEKVVVFCYGQNDYFWTLLDLGISSNVMEEEEEEDITQQERLGECIRQMQGLAKRDPTELVKTQLLAHEVGMEYRKIRLSLGL